LLDQNRDDLVSLQELYDELKTYKSLLTKPEVTQQERRDRENLRERLVRKSGALRQIVVRLVGIQHIAFGGMEFDVWVDALTSDAVLETTALDGLIDNVNQALGRLEREVIVSPASPLMKPKAFIAQGGESRALTKMRDFLDSLGVESLVVEKQSSEDRSVNTNVEHYLKQADCAIVLATKGDIDGQTGEFLPRGNILVEIGRCQERFSGRTIYLLEVGAKFPSNISEKVRERFTQDNMEDAFVKVAKELRAFGIIKTGKPDK